MKFAAWGLAAWILGVAASALSATISCPIRRTATHLPLRGFDSQAEIVRPGPGKPMTAVAILFQGSDVADLDGTIVGDNDAILSRPMRQVAETLACAGVSSLRYNKRFVTGPSNIDRERFDGLTGADLAEDGRTAVMAARSQPDLAGLPVVLVGWSEGTTVAMAVAAAEPAVRAVVLMAPVVDSPAHVAQAQYARVGRPYLARFARDGVLDADAISRADAGPGGVLAHIFVRMFRGFRAGERVNPLLDTNKDGQISLIEADPIVSAWYEDGPNSGLGMSASSRALKGVAAAYNSSLPPLLILQGLHDSMIDPQAAISFAKGAGAQRVTLRTYSGLGHSLGPASSVQQDGLTPTAEKPLREMAAWLKRILARQRASTASRSAEETLAVHPSPP